MFHTSSLLVIVTALVFHPTSPKHCIPAMQFSSAQNVPLDSQDRLVVIAGDLSLRRLRDKDGDGDHGLRCPLPSSHTAPSSIQRRCCCHQEDFAGSVFPCDRNCLTDTVAMSQPSVHLEPQRRSLTPIFQLPHHNPSAEAQPYMYIPMMISDGRQVLPSSTAGKAFQPLFQDPDTFIQCGGMECSHLR